MDGRRPVRLRVRSRATRAEVAGRQWPRMDLQTGDRAPTDVAQVPAGESGLPPPGPDRGQTPGRLGRLGHPYQVAAAAAMLIVLAALVWHFNVRPRHEALSAVPDALRGIAATVVLFGV